jgi:adenylate cyclase
VAGERRRRLAAILAADVVGYSRLVGADEEGTLARLRTLFCKVVQPTVAAHRGRVFKLMGDAFLAEFPSAVEAMRCAAAIQEAVGVCGAGEPDDRRILLRAGVHLRDVMVEGGDLLGDGVNATAQLEASPSRAAWWSRPQWPRRCAGACPSRWRTPERIEHQGRAPTAATRPCEAGRPGARRPRVSRPRGWAPSTASESLRSVASACRARAMLAGRWEVRGAHVGCRRYGS